MDKINDIVAAYGRILDEGCRPYDKLDDADDSALRAILRVSAPKQGRKIVKPLTVAASFIGAVCVAWMTVTGLTAATPVPFYVNGHAERSHVGRWLRTKAGEKSRIGFADGSAVEIQERSETRIIEADEKHVTVDLNTGRLFFDVAHDRGNDWTVRAGPFAVLVVGTRFSVQWDATSSLFLLNVSRGTVRVIGPGISNDGVSLSAGNGLRADADSGVIAIGPDEKLRNSPLTPDKLDFETGQDAAHATAPTVPDAMHPTSRKNEVQEWKKLSRDKQYGASLHAAKALGIAFLSRTLEEKDLWQLANTARYAKDPESAEALFVAYRTRFPGSAKRETAAYLLGLTATAAPSDAADAAFWFETYLREDENGPLAQEAIGRLINLKQKTGRPEEAKAFARTYLSRFPEGPFAAPANRLLKP
jgi:TolA-binding protein